MTKSAAFSIPNLPCRGNPVVSSGRSHPHKNYTYHGGIGRGLAFVRPHKVTGTALAGVKVPAVVVGNRHMFDLVDDQFSGGARMPPPVLFRVPLARGLN